MFFPYYIYNRDVFRLTPNPAVAVANNLTFKLFTRRENFGCDFFKTGVIPRLVAAFFKTRLLNASIFPRWAGQLADSVGLGAIPLVHAPSAFVVSDIPLNSALAFREQPMQLNPQT